MCGRYAQSDLKNDGDVDLDLWLRWLHATTRENTLIDRQDQSITSSGVGLSNKLWPAPAGNAVFHFSANNSPTCDRL